MGQRVRQGARPTGRDLTFPGWESRRRSKRKAAATTRLDPIEVIGRTGGVYARPGDFDRDRDPGRDGRCGVVEVDGLRYEIRYGPRTRTVLIDDSSGVDVPRPVFAYAVWAEPVALATILADE